MNLPLQDNMDYIRRVWYKLKQYDLTPQNIVSYTHWRCSRVWCGLWGIVRLRCKAALLGVRVGAQVRCAGTVLLGRWPDSRIEIGNGVSLVSSSTRATAATVHAPVRLHTHSPTASIILAKGVQLTGTSITVRSTSIYIGKNTMIAPNCCIVDSDFHAHAPPERRHLDPGYEHDAPVYIGDHVWVGMNCLILKGVRIGDGAIIAAGSVVTRDIPSLVLAAGVPARVLRPLIPSSDKELADEYAMKNR